MTKDTTMVGVNIDDTLSRLMWLAYLVAFLSLNVRCSNLMANDLPSTTSLVPRSFHDVKEIKAYFDQQGVPVDVKAITGRNEIYYFAKAYPYSGVDTTDLYCFVKRGEVWVMYLKAFLWKTPKTEDVKFEAHDDFVDVICKGIVVLKLNPPK